MDFYGVKPDPDDPRLICEKCVIPLQGPDNGFYYCNLCGIESQDIVHAVADEDDLHATGGVSSLYNPHLHRKSQPLPPLLIQPITKIDPSKPQDFPGSIPVSPGDLASGIRARYVGGLQLVLQRQCAALVERFGVSPIVAGLVGTLWLRFVAASRVFDEGWPERAVAESEAVAAANDKLVVKKRIRAKHRSEPHNRYGQRSAIIWFYALRRAIPVYSTLAISYLACHIAREAILPTDISKWAEEGKLPYLTVFMEIDKIPVLPSSVCPFSSKFMFRYFRVVGAWELEATAGSISHTIGLRLPSVNFYGIACRYLKELSLPAEKILPHACRLYQWSMPPDLWLSANVYRLPTRVCVMAILIITVRILYNIHGQGFWEKSLPGTSNSNIGTQKVNSSSYSESKKRKRCDDNEEEDVDDVDYDTEYSTPVKNLSAIEGSDFNTTELLHILETVYDKIRITYDYSKDLPSYLEYCKEIAFAGRIHSSEEERLIERLWDVYKMQEGNNEKLDTEKPDTKEKNLRDELSTITSLVSKESREKTRDSPHIDEKKLLNQDGFACTTDAPPRDVAIGNMKLDMEVHGFEYLSPRSKLISTDYLHYMRKKADGKLNYVAHTDYYILLRACARLAQVDVRVMHLGVLKLERRLKWTEQQIDSSLRWVYQTKYRLDETVEHRKAYLVARGVIQQYRVDCEESVSIAHMLTVHTLLAFVTVRQWAPYHMDVKNHNTLSEVVYMTSPLDYSVFMHSLSVFEQSCYMRDRGAL